MYPFDEINDDDNKNVCLCCFKQKKPNFLYKCSEGHQVCSECIRTSIHNQMAEGRPSNKCIAMSKKCICNGIYKFEELRKIIGKASISNMIKQETINAIQQSDVRDIFICAHCGYQFSLVNKRLYRVKYCPVCNKGTCVLCGLKEHQGKSCKIAKKEEYYATKGISFCPKCRLEFVKDKGCNMINCPKCNTYFCFKCGKRINRSVEGYSHFSEAKNVPPGKCPLRSRTRGDRHNANNILIDIYEENEKKES